MAATKTITRIRALIGRAGLFGQENGISDDESDIEIPNFL
jgi:hypothetical protein